MAIKSLRGLFQTTGSIASIGAKTVNVKSSAAASNKATVSTTQLSVATSTRRIIAVANQASVTSVFKPVASVNSDLLAAVQKQLGSALNREASLGKQSALDSSTMAAASKTAASVTQIKEILTAPEKRSVAPTDVRVTAMVLGAAAQVQAALALEKVSEEKKQIAVEGYGSALTNEEFEAAVAKRLSAGLAEEKIAQSKGAGSLDAKAFELVQNALKEPKVLTEALARLSQGATVELDDTATFQFLGFVREHASDAVEAVRTAALGGSAWANFKQFIGEATDSERTALYDAMAVSISDDAAARKVLGLDDGEQESLKIRRSEQLFKTVKPEEIDVALSSPAEKFDVLSSEFGRAAALQKHAVQAYGALQSGGATVKVFQTSEMTDTALKAVVASGDFGSFVDGQKKLTETGAYLSAESFDAAMGKAKEFLSTASVDDLKAVLTSADLNTPTSSEFAWKSMVNRFARSLSTTPLSEATLSADVVARVRESIVAGGDDLMDRVKATYSGASAEVVQKLRDTATDDTATADAQIRDILLIKSVSGSPTLAGTWNFLQGQARQVLSAAENPFSVTSAVAAPTSAVDAALVDNPLVEEVAKALGSVKAADLGLNAEAAKTLAAVQAGSLDAVKSALSGELPADAAGAEWWNLVQSTAQTVIAKSVARYEPGAGTPPVAAPAKVFDTKLLTDELMKEASYELVKKYGTDADRSGLHAHTRAAIRALNVATEKGGDYSGVGTLLKQSGPSSLAGAELWNVVQGIGNSLVQKRVDEVAAAKAAQEAEAAAKAAALQDAEKAAVAAEKAKDALSAAPSGTVVVGGSPTVALTNVVRDGAREYLMQYRKEMEVNGTLNANPDKAFLDAVQSKATPDSQAAVYTALLAKTAAEAHLSEAGFAKLQEFATKAAAAVGQAPVGPSAEALAQANAVIAQAAEQKATAEADVAAAQAAIDETAAKLAAISPAGTSLTRPSGVGKWSWNTMGWPGSSSLRQG